MPIKRWEDGDVICSVRLNAHIDGLDECMSAVKRLETLQRAQEAKPTGAAAVVAGGLVAAGSATAVSRRSLLGLGWFRGRT